MLKYLNLENNKLEKTNEYLLDLFYIETFKIANNILKNYPYFEKTQSDGNNADTILEITLNNNQIEKIKYFTFMFGKLILANFGLYSCLQHIFFLPFLPFLPICEVQPF
jgi:hypothetical protein